MLTVAQPASLALDMRPAAQLRRVEASLLAVTHQKACRSSPRHSSSLACVQARAQYASNLPPSLLPEESPAAGSSALWATQLLRRRRHWKPWNQCIYFQIRMLKPLMSSAQDC